ncbi:MAG: HAMP domain-containing histidine kinase [Deltaproteobacteria bacterium]|nr:MAG: HAMP domain-containing histidine kinase [Deltaproteobacteria bacterium]
MKARLPSLVQGLVIAAGFSVALASLFSFRLEDWPIYVTYVLLSMVLYRPTVEVLPGLLLPMPGLALSIGFLYIGGLPIVFLTNLGSALVLLVRAVLPEGWRRHLPELRGGGTEFVGRAFTRDPGALSDWAGAYLGLGARWAVVFMLSPGAPPVTDPGVMIAAEVAGYAAWTVLSLLPVFSFSSVLRPSVWAAGPPGEVRRDLSIITALALTPFVFLIAYGYEHHGLLGATAGSVSALGLHLMLKHLNERRVTVEEQNRRLEALNRELEHRERLSAIGKMSSVISHQMLQQLGVIGIYADLIRNADADGEPAAAVAQARANAGAIEDALGSVNRVLTDLLVFSRDLKLNLYEHRLFDVLAEAVEECGPQAAEGGVTIRLECPQEATARLDKLKIKQAVVNVLRNAIEASPRDAEVLVSGALADSTAAIAVTDRGAGVPESSRARIFTPFFTTKEQGSGLGLAIAREFAEAHGGTIAVGSGEGGTTFVLRLPRAEPEA